MAHSKQTQLITVRPIGRFVHIMQLEPCIRTITIVQFKIFAQGIVDNLVNAGATLDQKGIEFFRAKEA